MSEPSGDLIPGIVGQRTGLAGIEAIAHPHAWVGREVADGSWRSALSSEAIDGLRAFAKAHQDLDLSRVGDLGAGSLKAGPAGSIRLSAAPELSPLRRDMRAVATALDDGLGFAVVGGVPIGGLSDAETQVAVWAMFGCLGPVVDQKYTGTKVYDVKDQGVAFGHGVRRSITNQAQEFHTDAGWLSAPPEYIGLCCRRPADEGGANQVLSLATVHNRLLEAYPNALARLYEGFWWDRQAEHPEGEPLMSRQSVYYRDEFRNQVSARYYDDYVRKGHRLAGELLDVGGLAALERMQEVVGQANLPLEFGLQTGEFLFVNNRRLAHSRSAFQDLSGKRHYYRLWCRRHGATRLEG